jgi:guanylate kinase
MIVLVGASASGKTELAKILYQYYGYTKCVTSTTRPPRIHERDGIDYHFLDLKQFQTLKELGGFAESATYHGHCYGIQKQDVKDDGVVIVEPNGANTLIEALGNQVYVVYVHASEAIRTKRMMQRGDESSIILERIEFDKAVFHTHQLKRIDFIAENETESLDMLAKQIDQMYQRYLNHTTKKG